MSRTTFGTRLVCAVAVALAAASPAAAQGANGGPFAGLFGGGTKGDQSLDLRGGFFGTYDDNLLAQAPNGGDPLSFDPRLQSRGLASGFNSSLSYGFGHVGHGRSRSLFQFGAVAAVSEFSTGLSAGTLWSPSSQANAAFSTNLTPKISIQVRANAGYAPYYQYAPFLNNVSPSTVVPADTSTTASSDTAAENIPALPNTTPQVNPVNSDTGFATSSNWVSTVAGSAMITDRFTRRTGISADVGADQEQIIGRAHVLNEYAHSQLSHNLTRKLSVHIGYGLLQSEYTNEGGPTQRTFNHLVDFGADYGDGGRFTFGRYYTLTFSTGLSTLHQGNQTAFNLNGAVNLSRSIGRSWSASIGAARATQYVLGIVQPLLTDSINAGFGGEILPRLQFTAGGGYMRGQQAFFASDSAIQSKSVSSKLTFALARYMGLYAQYSYYQYDIPAGFFQLDFPRNFNRRMATVGLTFWAPIINQRPASNR